jgi:hypothetical protein
MGLGRVDTVFVIVTFKFPMFRPRQNENQLQTYKLYIVYEENNKMYLDILNTRFRHIHIKIYII